MTALEIISNKVAPLVLNEQVASDVFNTETTTNTLLPVVDAGYKFLGYIAAKDLRSMGPDHVIGIQDVKQGVTLPADCHYTEMVKIFDSLSADLIAVVDSHQGYLGAVNLQSLVGYWATFIGIKQSGSVVVLQVRSRDFMLSEVVRIVESNDVKILNIEVKEASEMGFLWVSMKLDTGILKGVLASLERYNYRVYAYFMRTDLQDDSDLRYMQLMKYLDV